MSNINIRTDGISQQQKATSKFQSFYQCVLTQINVPGFIDVLCAHEAAHLFYFTIAGTTDFAPCPTTIRYDSEIDDYVCDLAAIKILKMTMWTEGNFWDWFHKIACAHACGGVVARKLMPSTDGGDEDDRERFKQLCEHISNHSPSIPAAELDFERWWKQAQDTVTKMLDDPKIAGEIKRIAAALRPQLGL